MYISTVQFQLHSVEMVIRLKVVVLIWLFILIWSNNASIMKFTNAVCESFNKTLIAITECRLRAVSRNVTTYNFNSTIHYPITEVAVEVQCFKKANGYKPWLYKIKFDGCKFLQKGYNPVALLMFKLFKDYSNLNHPCPYIGHVYVKNLFVSPDVIPLPLPSGDYLLSSRWIFQKKLTTKLDVYFSFTEDILQQ